MKNWSKLLGGALLFTACNLSEPCKEELAVIPLPAEMHVKQGYFELPDVWSLSMPEGEEAGRVYRYLQQRLPQGKLKLTEQRSTDSAVMLATLTLLPCDTLPDEAYQLEVTEQGIRIASNPSGAGWFYGVQTLLQLLPTGEVSGRVPLMQIHDAPRFPYRGAMMDVARNFLPKEEVLKFIDAMATYKLNKFHFHLTDDQGWRIEIKRFPRLIEVGSKRLRTQLGHSDYYYPRRYDNKEQRGYYTQEEMREIVAYAADRFITVIPEVEMPGHASAALAAYPQLSCGLGKNYVVRDYFDVFDEVYCPKEETFRFLEGVLDEVMEIFPSHYIHIGGDECPKKAWKQCAHCQALMKREGLADEVALQSWFIHRMEQYVVSRGRDIIGWDEILEGGLAPHATVMSWRGEAGGIEAARLHHQVIMTPGHSCYFDFYQQEPVDAPMAIKGYLPLDSVYAYNPLPSQLTPEEQRYIVGVQANIWGEYIQTPQYFEYMAFPRLLAMSEVQWTAAEKKDFTDFARRLDAHFPRLEASGIAACRDFYQPRMEGRWNAEKQQFEMELSALCPEVEIRYALGDSLLTASSPLYQGPVALTDEQPIYAALFREGKPLGEVRSRRFAINKATGRPYRCTPAAGWEHLHPGRGLTDGWRATPRDMRHWVSFYQDTVRIVLDLQQPQEVSRVTLATLWRPWNTIWPARQISIALTNEETPNTEATHYTEVATLRPEYDFSLTEGTRFPVSLSFPAQQARFVRLTLLGGGPVPQGWFDEGKLPELAIDEIELL